MRIKGLLEGHNAATALLDTLGVLGYATDSQGARAPPSFADPDAPELPFTCDLDGVVYEPEPWKLARQQRLERHARQRDHIAGIVVYDGEWKEEAETPSEADPHPQAIEGSQATIFPDEFDQRPPEEWQERQWDPPSQQWQDTRLPQWPTQANCWDGADPIPPEDDPVLYNDQTVNSRNRRPHILVAQFCKIPSVPS